MKIRIFSFVICCLIAMFLLMCKWSRRFKNAVRIDAHRATVQQKAEADVPEKLDIGRDEHKESYGLSRSDVTVGKGAVFQPIDAWKSNNMTPRSNDICEKEGQTKAGEL